MSLSDLPKEILLDIVDYLDSVGTNAPAHTNSGLCQFLNEYLYRQDLIEPQSKSLTWAAGNGVKSTVQRALDASSRYFNLIPESFDIALQIAAD